MRPEVAARKLLSVTQSKAKMYEYNVPLDDHIALYSNPNDLFSLAVGLLGDAAAFVASADKEKNGRDTTLNSLRFAGIYFDAYIQSKLDAEVVPEFGVLAASAYYLSDSPGNARVIIDQHAAPPAPELGPLYALTYWLLHGRIIKIDGENYENLPTEVLDLLGAYFRLETDGVAILSTASKIRELAYLKGSDRDILYADVAAAICKTRIANSSRMLLPHASDLPLEKWRTALKRKNFPLELWPSQKRICDAGLLKGLSAVIQMPTSAGKTRATELIIRASFLSQRTNLAVIVAPYRALCHDIRSDLAKAFSGEEIALDEVTDSYQFDLNLEEFTKQKSILVVTPEKLLYVLRRAPELAEEIGLVIYDEGHLFDSAERGVTYELLLTSLKITLSKEAQVILISAVIKNASNVAEWLIGVDGVVVDGSGMLPTTKSLAFASWTTERGQLQYVNPTAPDDREFFVPRVIEQIAIPRKGRKKAWAFPKRDGGEMGLYLGLRIVSNGPVAVFCGRKDSVAGICERAVVLSDAEALPWNPAKYCNPDELQRLISLIENQLGADSAYARAAKLGIAAHHASIPHGTRLSVEHAMKHGLIHFVVCTSTLAQGVNLPIRYLIVTSVNQAGERIMVRDFHNLIGRAGRAGMHTEGSILFSAPNIFDDRRSRTDGWRWRQAKQLLNPVNSEPCESFLLKVFEPFSYGNPKHPDLVSVTLNDLLDLLFNENSTVERLVTEEIADQKRDVIKSFRNFMRERARVVHAIASYILAHIDYEAEGAFDTLEDLASNTLASHFATESERQKLRELFRGIAELLGSDRLPEIIRRRIKQAPIAPSRVLQLSTWLGRNGERLMAQMESADTFREILGAILSLGLPTRLSALSDTKCVTAIIEQWIAEASFVDIWRPIFESDVRIGGNRRHVTIDDVVSICEGDVGYELAMHFASLSDLAIDDFPALSALIGSYQKRLKHGLATDAAVGFYELGMADRSVATVLARQFPRVSDRFEARRAIRANLDNAREIIRTFPSYFNAVLDEISSPGSGN